MPGFSGTSPAEEPTKAPETAAPAAPPQPLTGMPLFTGAGADLFSMDINFEEKKEEPAENPDILKDGPIPGGVEVLQPETGMAHVN